MGYIPIDNDKDLMTDVTTPLFSEDCEAKEWLPNRYARVSTIVAGGRPLFKLHIPFKSTIVRKEGKNPRR